MATDIEYALMAGRSYYDTREDINRFPIPTGWTEKLHEAQSSGFEAVSFQRGTEVVIAYAGTYNKDISGDVAADLGLATGYGSVQLLQAANYFLQIRATYPDPNVSIAVTGHSLGGGLAALVGVFFGVRAYAFNQAPFANSAESNSLLSNPFNILAPDVAANLRRDLLAMGYAESDLAGLTNFLQLREANGGIPNSDLVTTIRVEGEFLGAAPYDPIGPPATQLAHGDYFGPIDLHSQALLTSFLQSPAFREMTSRQPQLLGMIFDSNLFANATDTATKNFLEHLVRHQVGVSGAFSADAMLDRFTSDLDKLVIARGGAGGYRES